MDKHKQITVLLKNHAELCFALSNTCVKNICMQNIRRLFFIVVFPEYYFWLGLVVIFSVKYYPNICIQYI